MKKKYWIWGLGIGIIVAGILLGIAALTMLKPTRLTIDVAPIHSVNYNNYIQDNQLDYKGNLLGWASRSPFGGTSVKVSTGPAQMSKGRTKTPLQTSCFARSKYISKHLSHR